MNASLFLAMFVVVACWAPLLVMLIGIGLGLQRTFGLRSIKTSTVLISPWNGLAIVILFLQTWHFFLAIRWPALTVAMIAGAVGLWASRRELLAGFRSRRIGWKLPLIVALASIWLANRAIGPGDAFDSGLYHYSVVRWSHEYPIMIGLANLHPLYALNNSCHLFVAMLQVGPMDGRANHLANGVLLLIWFATAAVSAAELRRGIGNRAQLFFHVVLLVPLVMYAVGKEPSNPTSDLPLAAVAFAAASAFIRLLTTRADDDDPGERALFTLSVVLLCAAGVTIKLSAAATFVPMALIALAVFLVTTSSSASLARWRGATLGWSIGLAGALAVTWVARGFLLSGCPIFPSRFLSAPVDWRVPAGAWPGVGSDFRSAGEFVRVGMLQRALASPAFQSVPRWIATPLDSALQNSNGKGAWLLAIVFASTIEIALPACLALLGAAALVRRKIFPAPGAPPIRAIEWLICVPPVIGLAVWFVVSPEPRYAASSIWILAAALVAMMIRSTHRPGRFIAIMLLLATTPIAYRMLILKVNPISGPVYSALFIPAGPDHGFHPIPRVEMVEMRTVWDTVIYFPKTRSPVWDAPLPATAELQPGLMYRIPDDPAAGFMVNRAQE